MTNRLTCVSLLLVALCLLMSGCGNSESQPDISVNVSISEEDDISNSISVNENAINPPQDYEVNPPSANSKTEYIFSGVEISEFTFDGDNIIRELNEYYSSIIRKFPEEEYDSSVSMDPELMNLLTKENSWSAPVYTDENFKYHYFSDSRGAYLVPFEYTGSGSVAIIPRYVKGYPVRISDLRKITADTLISYAEPDNLYDLITINSECKVFAGFSEAKYTISGNSVELVYLPYAKSVSISNATVLTDVCAPSATTFEITQASDNVSLKKLYFPNVTNLMGFRVSGSSLELLCLPKWEVKRIDYKSDKNQKLKTIICSTSGTVPRDAFRNATEIENIFFTTPPRNIETYAFAGCKGLKYVNLEQTVSVGDYAFSECGLETLKMNALVSSSSYSFQKMPNLKQAYLPSAEVLADYSFYSCPVLKIVYASELEKIGRFAFSECNSLEMADYPKVRTLGSNAFANDISLLFVKFKRLKVIESEAFSNCTALKEAYFDSVQRIGKKAFKDDKALQIIDIEGVTSIEAFSFENCSSLTKVNIPYATKINNEAFKGCTSLVIEE